MMTKNTICLWYAHDAEEAARFYAETFAHSQGLLSLPTTRSMGHESA